MSERVFLYGTLLPEHVPAAMAATVARLREVGDGSVPGRFYDLGAYPGAVLDPLAATRVRGRVFALPDDPGVLAALDRYEGFDPADARASLFLRTRATVELAHGGTTDAWIYVYNRRPGSAPPIVSGRFTPH